GAVVRVLMNAVAAVLLLIFRHRMFPAEAARKLWTWMAILALACIPLLAVSLTAVDRIALYFIPLQLVVFSQLPRIARSVKSRTAIVVGIVGYYGAVQFVW